MSIQLADSYDPWYYAVLCPASINQSILFNETNNRLKVPADTAAAGTVQWQS